MSQEYAPTTFQQGAEHYHVMIWTAFSVGIAASLIILDRIWIYKSSVGFMHFCMGILGFLIVIYCNILIESFGQKRKLLYDLHNNIPGRENVKKELEKLPYIPAKTIGEIILLIIAGLYAAFFTFIALRDSLRITMINDVITLIFAYSVAFTSVVGLGIIIGNWVKRRISL